MNKIINLNILDVLSFIYPFMFVPIYIFYLDEFWKKVDMGSFGYTYFFIFCNKTYIYRKKFE